MVETIPARESRKDALDLPTASSLLEPLRDTLEFSRSLDFAGHNKHDALNSPLLGPVLGWARWPRLLGIQAVMRAPINLRPWLLVPRTRNPKGIALFAHALLDLYANQGKQEDLSEAMNLLDWLLENPSQGFQGLSWGYPYPWQDVGFFAPRHFPNRVVTSWIGLAFLEGVRLTGEHRYRQALLAMADFLTGEPNILCDTEEMKCYSYVPDPTVTWAVMDVPALVGAFLAEAGQLLGRTSYQEEGKRLMNWVADKQQASGAWFYTHPPGDSHISHDNYHTAIILDCLDRYRVAAGDDGFDEVYWTGLEFYEKRLFTEDGAPRWMSDQTYPHDIHGAASALLCLTRAATRRPSYWLTTKRVLDWTLTHMYSREGRFFYQKSKWWTRKFTLMRWCNAWMCRALASMLRSLDQPEQHREVVS